MTLMLNLNFTQLCTSWPVLDLELHRQQSTKHSECSAQAFSVCLVLLLESNFLPCTNFAKTSIYLFCSFERQGKRGRHRDRSSIYWFSSKWLQQPGLDLADTGSQESTQFSTGVTVRCLRHTCCFQAN